VTRAVAVEYDRNVTVAQVDDFDEVIDVRSPSEYALDHVPGAINCPVLDDAQRARIGTLYKQVSPFAAKRSGAALVARNIAQMLEERLSDRPPRWSPLVYCWRGGGRSDALCEVLRRVGWRAARLRGGYQAYRRGVVQDLERLPQTFRFQVLCGRTGSGKSLVLHALGERGAQVLDLEGLACHRGSVLGDVPGCPQPAQKMFESLLWDRLRRFDPARPVFIEAESRKVGNLQVPGALIAAMRTSPCAVVQAPVGVRSRLLMEHYAHFLEQEAFLVARLSALTSHYGHAVIEHWCALARAGRHRELVAELLERHYDPAYDRSIERNFLHIRAALTYPLDAPCAQALEAVAERMLADGVNREPA
jgi:tRNA 2-selenouridine synthase